MRVCLIRHAATRWNEEGRIQGRIDVPLSAAGRAQAAAWRLPYGFMEAACVTSPLARARETAAILGFTDAGVDPRLAEMRWGAFEGRTLDELRAEHGEAMRRLEVLGVDFRPPGGESPRLVAERLAACLRDLAATGRDHLLVAHKGILRASLILALGWDMLGKPPVRFEPEKALLYELGPSGSLRLLGVHPLREETA
ncbi:histidine phosphatase family protein [Benzoatithermus flavus]|uniref:Histidine phosphatase family protein n=1 Tax=Benzoatithermus flavus TaxID=3108223 RepID=A0ABU8XQJ5_9PROT